MTGCLYCSTDLKLELCVFKFGCPAAKIFVNRKETLGANSDARCDASILRGPGSDLGRLVALPVGERHAAPPNNLPLQLSSFVGREKELAVLWRFLEDALPAKWASGRGWSRRDRRRGLMREGNGYVNDAYRSRCYPGDRRPGWRRGDRAGGSPVPLGFPLRPRGQRKETARAGDASTRRLPRCG